MHRPDWFLIVLRLGIPTRRIVAAATHAGPPGLRLTAGGRALAYTGDTGPCREIVDLARDPDLFLAEATYPDQVPAEDARYLSSARQAGEHAAKAGAGRLLLTHLWPGTPVSHALSAARATYDGDVDVAREDETVDLG